MYEAGFAGFEPFITAADPPAGPSVEAGFPSEDLGSTPTAIADALTAGGNDSDSMLANVISVIEDSLARIHRAMNYTEISKLNSYVDNIQMQEMQRIEETHESMANNLLLTQRMYLMHNRDSDKLASHIRALMYTQLTICLVFAIFPYSTTAPGIVALAVVTIVYMFGVLLYLRNARLRRYDDWNKLYWRSDIDASSLAVHAEDDDATGCAADGGLFDNVAKAPAST